VADLLAGLLKTITMSTHGDTVPLSFKWFRLAVFLIPASYGIKMILDVPQMIWVDPALLLAFMSLLLFLLERKSVPIHAVATLGLGFALIYTASAFLGAIFIPSWLGEAPVGAQIIFAEPVKLLLLLNFFSLAFVYAQESSLRRKMAYTLSVSAVLQLAVAILMVLAYYFPTSLTMPFQAYVDEYAARQSVWFGTTRIVRLAGTFWESPPFGLFMLGTFMVALLENRRKRSRLLRLASIFALLGLLGTISLQSLLGLLLFAGILLVGSQDIRPKSANKWALQGIVAIAASTALVPLFAVTAIELYRRIAPVWSSLDQPETLSGSFGERYFHLINGWDIVTSNVLNFLVGVGPRSYGFYTNFAVDRYAVTVTPQIMPIDILVGSGIIGLALFLGWLIYMLKILSFLPRFVGLAVWTGLLAANLTQATWKWPIVFFVLAFFLGQAQSSRTSCRSQHEPPSTQRPQAADL
jgi:hypothetical protein